MIYLCAHEPDNTRHSIHSAYDRDHQRTHPRAAESAILDAARYRKIPLSELIEESKNPERGSNDQLIFDLRKLREISLAVTGSEISKINAFVSAICARRRDWNGEILTLRSGDLDTLTLVLSAPRAAVQELLERFQLVIKVPEI